MFLKLLFHYLPLSVFQRFPSFLSLPSQLHPTPLVTHTNTYTHIAFGSQFTRQLVCHIGISELPRNTLSDSQHVLSLHFPILIRTVSQYQRRQGLLKINSDRYTITNLTCTRTCTHVCVCTLTHTLCEPICYPSVVLRAELAGGDLN